MGNRKRCWNTVLTVLLVSTLCFIWGNSLLDREESSDLSQGILAQLAPLIEGLGLDTQDDHWLRKLAHFLEFALLGGELILLFYVNAGARPASRFLSRRAMRPCSSLPGAAPRCGTYCWTSPAR